MAQKVTFLGLGVMGFPMAGHIQKQGFDTCVWNRTPAKATLWQQTHQGTVGATIAEAVTAAEIVCMCLGNDDDVRSVAYGGVMQHMPAGSLLIDHTTTSATLARELASKAVERNIAFIDAPISGGQAGAENGELTVMVGGSPEDFARASDIFATYAKKTTLTGPIGSGQMTKMANQICIAGILEGLSEALVFAQANGLDCTKVIEAISQGAAQSWQMHNRATTMVCDQFDFGFAVDWMIKDLGYCLQQAKLTGLELPVTEMVLQQYRRLSDKGGGRLDTSSLIRSLTAHSAHGS